MPLLEEFLDLAVFEQLPDVALRRAEVEGVLTELVLENPKVPLQRLHLLFHPGDFDGGESLHFFGLVFDSLQKFVVSSTAVEANEAN